jgi:hypothetical protein
MPRLKIRRASTSSSGSSGCEENWMSSSEMRPVTVMMTVMSWPDVRATRLTKGSRSPTSVTVPSSKSMRWPRMEAAPDQFETADRLDAGDRTGDAHAAAKLGVEAAAAHEDAVGRVDLDVEAGDGGACHRHRRAVGGARAFKRGADTAAAARGG